MKFPFFNKAEEKANPPKVLFADESTRGAINKVTLPNFMLRPPFGVPRFKDIVTLRRLANTPQARMAKQTIIDEVVSIPWEIVPKDETIEISDEMQAKIDEITNFLNNPNTNNQSLEYLFRGMMEDMLDIDSGIWVKEFDKHKRMVEIKFADAATFLKNPDIHGNYIHREDIIPIGSINIEKYLTGQNGIDSARAVNAAVGFQTPVGLNITDARNKAAYFQFGYLSNVRPLAFGKREIVWFENNPQTNQIYGKSPIESILNVLQSLKYCIEYNLDYFEDNNVPKGFIQLSGADDEEMQGFRDKWNELQLKTNAEGLMKKNFHRVPITNTENAQFVRVQFSSAELELIQTQEWFSKLVWATYGVTPSELGFTENSNLATETNQGKVFKRKAILPKLRMIEYIINSQIINEWDFSDDLVFKFNTFDIDDEKAKFELYKIQKDMGFRTSNEIRRLEGLEELEDDELELTNVQDDMQNNNDKDKEKDKEINKPEKKALTLESIMSIFEKDMDSQKNILIKELRKNSNNRLTQIKAFSDIINAIKGFFSIEGLKSLIEQVTSEIFNDGVDNIESLIKRKNIQVNAVVDSPEKKEFLSEMVIANIKGLSDDAQRKLDQQLKIGVSNGEGVPKLIERVNSVINVAKNRAAMIASTEATRINGAGQMHAALQIQDDGVNIKKYIIMVDDNKTSDLSRALNKKYGTPGQAIPVDKNFKLTFQGKTYDQLTIPFHPFDRDDIVEIIVE